MQTGVLMMDEQHSGQLDSIVRVSEKHYWEAVANCCIFSKADDFLGKPFRALFPPVASDESAPSDQELLSDMRTECRQK